MPNSTTLNTGFSDSKSHYQILDGLRGVAAIMVVAFHVLEAFTGTVHSKQIINHGYLAVDFFFALSGFVIGYAYDDRWNKMTLKDFFKRRLIRLHPMIIMGMIIGAIGFLCTAPSPIFAKMHDVSLLRLIAVMLFGFTLLPLPTSQDIRGWDEMHPLNGPAWSLFFEYVANILYALFIRKFSKTVLAIIVFIAGAVLIHFCVTNPNGDITGGWSLEPTQFKIGLIRLMYPFFAGLLLSRVCKPTNLKQAFLWSSLLLIAVLSIPRLGGTSFWVNGLYEALCIILVFPAIIYIGASGDIKGKLANKVCTFLGDISYPIYITHYTLIYIYTAWVVDNKVSLEQGWKLGLLVLIACIFIAYACFKWFDIPVRRWLTNKFLKKAE